MRIVSLLYTVELRRRPRRCHAFANAGEEKKWNKREGGDVLCKREPHDELFTGGEKESSLSLSFFHSLSRLSYRASNSRDFPQAFQASVGSRRLFGYE